MSIPSGIGGYTNPQDRALQQAAFAVLIRKLNGQSLPDEGAFELSLDTVYVYWQDATGKHHAEISSFNTYITP